MPPELLQSNERLERELRDELGRSASGTRQELMQGLAQFQQSLTQGLQGSNQSLAAQALAAIEALGAATVAEFEAAHGKVPGGEMLILALGRLGGGVLTHASDLDLVYLFTGDFLAESDGAKPLGATQYFNRLGQRITNALSVHTASGPLYEVDTRLRPSGAQGLLAVSIDSFARYQREEAWTWEHLALTRARRRSCR